MSPSGTTVNKARSFVPDSVQYQHHRTAGSRLASAVSARLEASERWEWIEAVLGISDKLIATYFFCMRVLVIEDEPQLAKHITRALDRHGHLASAQHDGLEGLNAALRESPDLIILDLN